jgi:hypothetical protein
LGLFGKSGVVEFVIENEGARLSGRGIQIKEGAAAFGHPNGGGSAVLGIHACAKGVDQNSLQGEGILSIGCVEGDAIEFAIENIVEDIIQ